MRTVNVEGADYQVASTRKVTVDGKDYEIAQSFDLYLLMSDLLSDMRDDIGRANERMAAAIMDGQSPDPEDVKLARTSRLERCTYDWVRMLLVDPIQIDGADASVVASLIQKMLSPGAPQSEKKGPQGPFAPPQSQE
jgi:hypothetical protein